MSQKVPEQSMADRDENELLTGPVTNRNYRTVNDISQENRELNTKVISENNSSHLSSVDCYRRKQMPFKHVNLETDSIGSAGSIMFDDGASSSVNKLASTNASLDYNKIDHYDEILVGEEKDFHNACRCGDLPLVKQLIKSGVDVNCRNKHDRTAMHWAAGNGHLEILQVLLDEGGAIDAADKFGMDTLLWAAWFGHKACVQLMMQVGAKSNSRNKHGYTWLHCAAQNNHLQVIEILNEEMQDIDKNMVDDTGRSCLHITCKYGQSKLACYLIQLGCNVKMKDKVGNTPLHTAAKYGFTHLISVLMEGNCNIEETNNNQQTALHIAAAEGNALFCEELLRYNADINPEMEDETCPIHLSVVGGHVRVTEVLLEHNADFDAANKHNQTPLHFAVVGNNLELCKLLLKAGANASVPDARSETPLHSAAENGLYDVTEILLLAHSNHKIKDLKGKTPLDIAARGNYVTIVDMILKAERQQYYLTKQSPECTPHFLNKVPASFKPDFYPNSQHLRALLYELASKHFKAIEWKRLAFYWGFTDRQLQAIEEQYTGSKSYKEHGHRMLLIWFHGCVLARINPVKSLYEGLVGIQRRDLAELMRSKATQTSSDKTCSVC